MCRWESLPGDIPHVTGVRKRFLTPQLLNLDFFNNPVGWGIDILPWLLSAGIVEKVIIDVIAR